MSEDTREYRRAKTAALQSLAAGGDVAAVQELERRGVAIAPPATDVTRLDDSKLRALVVAWRDGVTPEEHALNRALAEQAYAELVARYRVDLKLGDNRSVCPPQTPPWAILRPPRYVSWRRPSGSKLYPSRQDEDRAALQEIAVRLNRKVQAATVPQD